MAGERFGVSLNETKCCQILVEDNNLVTKIADSVIETSHDGEKSCKLQL